MTRNIYCPGIEALPAGEVRRDATSQTEKFATLTRRFLRWNRSRKAIGALAVLTAGALGVAIYGDASPALDIALGTGFAVEATGLLVAEQQYESTGMTLLETKDRVVDIFQEHHLDLPVWTDTNRFTPRSILTEFQC
ncbi:MAG TPA: hypothetical protein VIH90_02095 [Candidatus Saccharimonadales bacterium]